MKISKYLKYNGVQLIDPTFPFHKSCIEFYTNRGFLSAKQLASLKLHVHSPEAIERLLTKKKEKLPKPKKVVQPIKPKAIYDEDEDSDIPF